MSISAQLYGQDGPTLVPNALGLVYEDAIDSNVDGKVNVYKVNYTVEGIKVDLYREGYFYYSVTHKTPHATGAYLKSSLMDMMAWDATDHADLITQPLLVIAGEKADSRYMSEEAFAKASSTADKELFIVPGATHIRTYYVKEYVDQISGKIQRFFNEKLLANK